jgi:kumamolisin
VADAPYRCRYQMFHYLWYPMSHSGMMLTMPDATFVAVAGSRRPAVPNATAAGELDSSARIEITVVLRHRTELPRPLVEGRNTVHHEEFTERYGADPGDLSLVSRVLAEHGLEVTETDRAGRRVRVAGTVGRLAEVFGTELSAVSIPAPSGSGSITFRHREGELRVPAELSDAVVAVLGLDDRPQARERTRLAAAAAQQVSYQPPQLATAYGFPPDTDGSGQTIAIVELGGGFSQHDLDTYFAGLKLRTPKVTAVGVDGAKNKPGKDPQGADGEVLLDIEVAGALAPGADQMVYFAPNTDQGFLNAVTRAIHADPAPIAVSISWGGVEDQWTEQARKAMDSAFADAAALGITVTAAAGDNGSADGAKDGAAHTDFPAASPHALACGGTRLTVDSDGKAKSETVWNDGSSGGATGGGVSTTFALPSWQKRAGVPARPGGGTGRGVPDVAANADPATGYQVLVDGKPYVIGGTSAVAPLWAALVARLAQRTGHRFGLLQPLLYAGAAQGEVAPGFRDITRGDNGAYEAAAGWDACTGLGVPNGTALVSVLSS